MDRNAMWIFKKHRNAATIEESWETAKVGSRLLMFHSYFLSKVIDHNLSLEEQARRYDVRFGRPTAQMEQDMQKNIFRIQNINSFSEFFQCFVG